MSVYTLIMTAKPKIGPAEVARQCACFNLRKAARAVTQLYDAALEPAGLRATQISVLVALALKEKTPLGRVAEAMVMDRTTLTRNLKPLEREGWITIEKGPDRRERYVGLTRSGRAVLERALPLWQAVQARVAEGLGVAPLGALLGQLNDVTRVAQGHAPRGR